MAQILVVDDDAVSALVIARALTQVGHDASIARSGLQALEQLEAGGFDAVVTDWMMKELDGLELIRRVQLRFPPSPVTIMVTSPRISGSSRASWSLRREAATCPSPRQAIASSWMTTPR